MEQKTKICPYCGETILAVAKKCRNCGEWLDKDEKPSSSTPTEEAENPSAETNDDNQQQKPITTTDGQTVEQNPLTSASVAPKPKVTAIPTPTTKHTPNKAKLFIAVGIVLVIAVIMLIFHATYEYTTYWQEESTCQAIIGGVGLILLVLYLVIFCRKDIESLVSSRKHNVVPRNESSNKTGNKKSLKVLKWIVPLVVVLGLCGGGHAYYQHQNTIKETAYLNNAKVIKADSKLIVDAAGMILDDYYRNWRSAIFDKKAYNTEMEIEYCNDFNDAVNWRILYYSDEVATMDSLTDAIQNRLKQMTEVPKKYEPVDNFVKELYSKTKELVSLCHAPESSLRDFGNKVQDAITSVKNSLSASDILIDASYATTDNKIDMERLYEGASKSSKLK